MSQSSYDHAPAQKNAGSARPDTAREAAQRSVERVDRALHAVFEKAKSSR